MSNEEVSVFTAPLRPVRTHRSDPDLAVTDLAGAGRGEDRLDDLIGHRFVTEHLDFHLRKEIDGVLGSPVGLGVTSLATESLDLIDRHALHADGLQCVLHLLDLVRLDHRSHEIDHFSSLIGAGGSERTSRREFDHDVAPTSKTRRVV
jgi:hypothetical protein